MTPYSELKTREERNQRARWAAEQMRTLSPEDREELITGADNVIDGRAVFRNKSKVVELSTAYRMPIKPEQD
jgi:hypothetical protein